MPDLLMDLTASFACRLCGDCFASAAGGLPARSLLAQFEEEQKDGEQQQQGSGEEDDVDHEKAFKFYMRAAREDATDAEAHYCVGILYRDGEGCVQSHEKSVEWLSLAADAGHREALCALGTAYAEGKGVPQSSERAAEYYRKANESAPSMGFSATVPNAYYNLGVLVSTI